MIVQIEIMSGRNTQPTKKDIQKNIDELTEVIDFHISFDCTLSNTLSILEGIKRQLPEAN